MCQVIWHQKRRHLPHGLGLQTVLVLGPIKAQPLVSSSTLDREHSQGVEHASSRPEQTTSCMLTLLWWEVYKVVIFILLCRQ